MDLGDYPSEPDSSAATDFQPRMFWAFNYRNSQYYQITANLIVEGRYCRIWMEQGANVSTTTARNVASSFDTIIYPKMMQTFGFYSRITIANELVANNTLQLADYYGDTDGKLAILLLDIQDNYRQGINEAHVTGYFSKYDLIRNSPHSNNADIIYIDTNPERPGSWTSNKTLAHEMQHLLNYITSVLLRRDSNDITVVHEMDTWINEGLSAIAEWVYSGQHNEERWAYYNADPSGLIQKGNNFFIWGNHANEHNYAELDDYATVYLFFHWLRLQTGSNSIFTSLISSPQYTYRAVTEAADNAMEGSGYDDWQTLLKTWLAANYINATNGPYGYKGDSTLRSVKAKTVPEGTQNIRLYPGEGVYSITQAGFPWPGEGKDIKYAGLSTLSPFLSETTIFNGGALLTYNANPNEFSSPEEGITSGISSNLDTTQYEQRIRALLSLHRGIIKFE
jgi:hypothetical protein